MNSYSYLLPPTFVDEPSPTASHEPTVETTPLGPPMEGALVPHQPAKGRHERKCSICRHPDRDAIEEAFLHWQSPNEIATDSAQRPRVGLLREYEAFSRFNVERRFALTAIAPGLSVASVVKAGPKLNANRKSGLLANVVNH
jgi:hypothetical protein